VFPLVLCYHAVSDTWDDPLAVGTATIERQLKTLLRRGYRPAPLEEAAAGGRRLFHVTFDDAYRSTRLVVPLFERLGVSATVFACTGFAESGAPLLIPELVERSSGDELATMDWEMLRELVSRGIEVGSHTVTHAHLTQASDEALRHELRASRERIEAELGRPCHYVAYPYGDDDARVHAAARDAGYSRGFSLRPTATDGPFGCSRIEIYRGDGPVRFALKTSRGRPALIGAIDRARRGGRHMTRAGHE
jgi:peptidoglycan/xylan/chitin deacetylase (PgdA/CDA1 family)